MTTRGAKSTLLTAAMLVAGIRLWMQIRGKAKTPFNEWAVGWGATFFVLSLMSEVVPTGAGMLALLVAVGDFLNNGVSLTTDLSSVVTGSEKGSVLTPQPFSGQPAPSKVKKS